MCVCVCVCVFFGLFSTIVNTDFVLDLNVLVHESGCVCCSVISPVLEWSVIPKRYCFYIINLARCHGVHLKELQILLHYFKFISH